MESTIAKTVRLNQDESILVSQISHEKGISQATVIRQFVLDGLSNYRLEQAITAYANGEVDLSAAARHANISVYRMMKELENRQIELPVEPEKFVQGLKTLVDTFGGSTALQQTLTDLETSAP